MAGARRANEAGIISSVAMFLSLIPSEVFSAQSTSGAAFLGITPSVRSFALGQANALTALGAEAVGANPANLGLMSQEMEVYTSYSTLMDGSQFEHISMAYAPHGFFDGLGVSMTRLYTGGFVGADTSGNFTNSSFSAGDTAIALSASAHPTQNLRLGITGKMAQSAIAGYNSNWAPAADFGMTYSAKLFKRPFSIGASLLNFGQPMKFIDQADQLPEMANFGAAIPLGNFFVVAEFNRLMIEQLTQVSLGAEYRLGPVSFRLGYLEESQASNLALQDQSAVGQIVGSGLSEGLGVDLGDFRVDWAMSNQAVDFGTTQRLALSLRWGNPSSHSHANKKKKSSWFKGLLRGSSHPDQSDWLMFY